MKKLLALSLFAALAACGGGGGSNSPVTTNGTIAGTAATGTALANAAVSITNLSGNSPCVQASITTSGLGGYTCTVKSGETAPFFIQITDPTGNSGTLVSIAETTPAPGTSILVNATPLTTAIVAQLNGGDALGVVSNKSLYVPATFAAIKSNVIAQLQAVVTAVDPSIANYDPFTTSITAATAGTTGNTADQILDIIKLSTTSTGAPALSTISDPTPVPLATATTAGTTLAAPTGTLADLAQGTQDVAQAFNKCFSLSSGQRVTLNNGNITQTAADCQSLLTVTGTPAGAPAFKSNGYDASGFLYGWLTDTAMDGAKFSVPEIILVLPIDSTHVRQRAIINIKSIDNQGIARNKITVMQNFPSSSATSHSSNWWITGNQWNYDVSVKTMVRRSQGFDNGGYGSFQVGLDFYMADNPSSYDSALITGPGLPTSGIWYKHADYTFQLGISAYRGTSVPLPANTQLCKGCTTYWMSRTSALSAAGATTLSPNGMYFSWSNGADGSYNGSAGTRPIKGGIYTFTLYLGSTLVATETRVLVTNLVPATNAVNLPWNTVGSNTLAALDPTNTALNGTQTSLAIDWIQNPAAEKINNLWISQTDGSYNNVTPFKLGVTSVIATPYGSGNTFTALTGTKNTTAPNVTGIRDIGFSYYMLDGSAKQAGYSYWP